MFPNVKIPYTLSILFLYWHILFCIIHVRTFLYAPMLFNKLTSSNSYPSEHWFGFIEKWIPYLMHGLMMVWAVCKISMKMYYRAMRITAGKIRWKKKFLLIHASHCLPSPVFSQFLVMMDISNMIYFPLIFHIAFEYILLHVEMLVGIAACRCKSSHTQGRGGSGGDGGGGWSNIPFSWRSNQQWQAHQLHDLIM